MVRGGGGGGVVMLYCLLAPAAGGGGVVGYFQVNSVISVRVLSPDCCDIIRVTRGGTLRVNLTHLPPHNAVNLTSQHSSKHHHTFQSKYWISLGKFMEKRVDGKDLLKAPLCHKEPARSKKCPGCLELVLYGI